QTNDARERPNRVAEDVIEERICGGFVAVLHDNTGPATTSADLTIPEDIRPSCRAFRGEHRAAPTYHNIIRKPVLYPAELRDRVSFRWMIADPSATALFRRPIGQPRHAFRRPVARPQTARRFQDSAICSKLFKCVPISGTSPTACMTLCVMR